MTAAQEQTLVILGEAWADAAAHRGFVRPDGWVDVHRIVSSGVIERLAAAGLVEWTTRPPGLQRARLHARLTRPGKAWYRARCTEQLRVRRQRVGQLRGATA